MMISTGLTIGYNPGGNGKCWWKKGFLDLDTAVKFTADPLPQIGAQNRACFCRTFEPTTPPPLPSIPPTSPPVAPSSSYLCATGDPDAAAGIPAQTCLCVPGMTFYGPRYINEIETTNQSLWIEATTIEMMISTGLTIGYNPGGNGKCWWKKGFLDLDTAVKFTADPLPQIGAQNRACFCRTFEPTTPPPLPSIPPTSPPLIPPQLASPPFSPPVAPSSSYLCATGDPDAAAGIPAQTCLCAPGMTYYGPRYINELETTNQSLWIEATTIEMMI